MKNIRRILRFIKSIVFSFYYCPLNFLIRTAPVHIPRSIIIIRPDSIGDYILFRNFLQLFKTSRKYRDYSITLIGNECYKDLALAFDKPYIDHFIWIDRKKMMLNLLYRYMTLKSITQKSYELLINPVYCRGFFLDDTLSKYISAHEKISLTPHPTFNLPWQNRNSQSFYTTMLNIQTDIFEFERNKQFFSRFFDQTHIPLKPHLQLPDSYSNLSLPPTYFLIALGAGHPKREWSAENYAKVALALSRKCKIPCVLTGTSTDADKAKYIQNALSSAYVNLVNQCSLSDLPFIVQKASLIICNESSVAHIAVSLDRPCVVISNGNDFGRFTPYPREIAPYYHVIYPPSIRNTPETYGHNVQQYGNGSQELIDAIHPTNVIEVCLEVLSED